MTWRGACCFVVVVFVVVVVVVVAVVAKRQRQMSLSIYKLLESAMFLFMESRMEYGQVKKSSQDFC